ncbi:LysR family transcriptional regulator [Shewanella sp. Choline-02u-19]|uniref:LysR family transcriptional regulator n=1 Tax=unclassified Shewanella TaxID=196818 RepID=UPI000C348CF5|nr:MULTISPECIES: LysR family transcriptional regulator [unclassified Shewanella]PKG58433.1 LysR family transcriptional regulator [Shewanella sp. GutDb-MelDb]PKG74867.1 LysR family transcriptional regulator [Shewanella sp. GutCb]PKH53805.1 LysR family transcriptional regulator [Shewanella sp. Bg11-22]PKI28942.1 LysR family transcriptional regulator [Shewanella sp. Choline-02u-19]
MKTEDIALFHRIVETGSLVDAADLLNLPKSTVSRRLQSLEEDLHVKLFHRQSRSMTLTASGSHFYDKTLSILGELEQTMVELTDTEAEIGGHLRILMFPVPELLDIASGIFEFMDHNPELTVELIVSTEPQDMIRNNIDLAFMIEDAFNESEMVAREVLTEELHFVASPDYLAKAGTPLLPEDLEKHNSILFRYPNGRIFNEVPFGNDMKIAVKGNLCLNSLQLCLEASLAGRGIAFLPIEVTRDYVERGELTMLFEDVAPYIGKCYLVYPSRRFISLASQRFIDHMMAALKRCNSGKGCGREERLRGAIKSWI